MGSGRSRKDSTESSASDMRKTKSMGFLGAEGPGASETTSTRASSPLSHLPSTAPQSPTRPVPPFPPFHPPFRPLEEGGVQGAFALANSASQNLGDSTPTSGADSPEPPEEDSR